jgi:hypothetical protein
VLGIDPRPSAPAHQGLGVHDYPEDITVGEKVSAAAETAVSSVGLTPQRRSTIRERVSQGIANISKGTRKLVNTALNRPKTTGEPIHTASVTASTTGADRRQ